VRAIVGLRRIGGRWQVVHEHTSVPFHMDGSDRAALDLEP
jgi:ketosteroid isomerase-like protein